MALERCQPVGARCTLPLILVPTWKTDTKYWIQFLLFLLFLSFFFVVLFFFIQFRTKKIIRWIFCFFFVWLHLLNFDGGKKWRTDFIFLFLHFRFWCVNNVRFCLNFCFCLSLSLFLLRWRGWRGSEGIWLGSRDLSSREIHVSY